MSNPPQSQQSCYSNSRSMFYGHNAHPHSYANSNYGGYAPMQQPQQMPQMHCQSRSNPARGQYSSTYSNTNTSSCAPQMRLPSLCQTSGSTSLPPPGQMTQGHSGIVLPQMKHSQAQMASVGGALQCGYPMDGIQQTLAQYAQYTQPQLQQVMAQYPAWFQKELMRRLQRQYEEMYVVEDPKIHHWSAICPREQQQQQQSDDKKKVLSELPLPKSNHSHVMAVMASPASACGRSSCHFMSPSLSAGPHDPHFDGAYSPHHQPEATTSPPPEHPSLEPLDSEQAPSSHSSLISPRMPRALSDAGSLQPDRTSRATCFAILDSDLSNGTDGQDEAKEEDECYAAHASEFTSSPESSSDSSSKAQQQSGVSGGQTQLQAQLQAQSAAAYDAQKSYQNYQQAMQRWRAQQQQQAQMLYQQQLQFQQQQQQQEHQQQQHRQYMAQVQAYQAQMARHKQQQQQQAYYAQQQRAPQMQYMYKQQGHSANTQARFCA